MSIALFSFTVKNSHDPHGIVLFTSLRLFRQNPWDAHTSLLVPLSTALNPDDGKKSEISPIGQSASLVNRPSPNRLRQRPMSHFTWTGPEISPKRPSLPRSHCNAQARL